MAIITISRGSSSGGRILAECVAKELDYRLVSREAIIDDATRYGVSEAKLTDALIKPPKFWERFRDERSRYLTYLRAALCEQALNDNLVYHGNAGHFLLRGVGHVLRVRLVAPLEYRLAAVMETKRMNRGDAGDWIQRVDKERSRWTKFLYGVDLCDPLIYDMVLNLGHMEVSGACAMVCTAVKLPAYATTAASTQALTDLLLASRVRIALSQDDSTAVADVDVDASNGTVAVRGRLSSDELIEDVVRVAQSVPGVERVDRSEMRLWSYGD
jgi:cytidylate kinase